MLKNRSSTIAGMDKEILQEIRNHTLKNAIKFEGKASAGAVIGKILAAHPELKKEMKDVGKAIGGILKDVNRMSPEEQLKELKKTAPEMLIKEKKEESKEMPELPNAKEGKVVTRIPPEPSKYAHLGHAMSFLINYFMAQKYKGKCIIKFEDTNPEKVSQKFVDEMTDDILNYLKIKPDEIMLVSDDMPLMYEEAEKLIKNKKAYVCTCKREDMRDLRHAGKACTHRKHPVEKNLELWKKMLDGGFQQGEAVLRLVGDMDDDNHVMRDPVMFRISESEHFKHKDKYRVWPLYDFENALGDSLHGVTHILRSKEFGTMRNELQNNLKDLMGFPRQDIIHYGRINIRGAITSGRQIREAIAKGEVHGWDDPRLVTLKALKRRGILPEAIHNLVYEVGLSLTTTNIDFSVLAAINRKLMDDIANRYFFVPYPEEVKIEGAPELEVKLKLHPEMAERGYRTHTTSDTFLLAPEDIGALKEDNLYRLMDCLNFTKKGKKLYFDSPDYEKYRAEGKRIMHWLPAEADLVDVEILMPTGKWTTGKGEPSMRNIKLGEVIQAERFGFIKLDEIKNNTLKFWFTHR